MRKESIKALKMSIGYKNNKNYVQSKCTEIEKYLNMFLLRLRAAVSDFLFQNKIL